MATAKITNSAGADSSARKPRLVKLIVKNFRCIGTNPVTVELDDIVVLVGPNNTGKSSILHAYQTVMQDSELTLEDFPSGRQPENDAYPEIELWTVVYDDAPGQEWCDPQDDSGSLVREKWTWKQPGKPERRGYLVNEQRFANDNDPEKMPSGFASKASARRPHPHRVNPFAPPEEQTNEILRLLDAVLDEKIKSLASAEGEESDFGKLVKGVRELQKRVVQDSKTEIESIQRDLSALIGKVFPDHEVVFDPRPEEDVNKSVKFFTAQSRLRMGPKNGYKSTIDKQGSGARRTLIWTTLKLLADRGIRARPVGSKAKTPEKIAEEQPHLLLMDEPEICLHPSAIREASDLLYGLPASGNWQVMITTHSPCFIDFARDNTTIVRVEHAGTGEVIGTTIYRPSRAQLDEDDKQRLKLLNLCDPYVAEFFFGGTSIIVEGDTEHTAFGYIKQMHPEDFRRIHVVRARGKPTVVSLMKILNHFGTSYAVLHDTDTKTAMRKGKEIANPAWAHNRSIFDQSNNGNVRLVASLPNFEAAFFGEETKSEKPYHALEVLREKGDEYQKVLALLRYLTQQSNDLPVGAVRIEKLGDYERTTE